MTHDEVFSIADHLSLRQGAKIRLPADRDVRLSPLRRRDAFDARTGGPRLAPQPTRRIISAEIVTGMDELGVLIAGHTQQRLLVSARSSRSPRRDATCPTPMRPACRWRQARWRATIWAIRHPREGLREADELDFRECLESRVPISARWSAHTPTGRRCRAAASCSGAARFRTSRGCCKASARGNGLREESDETASP